MNTPASPDPGTLFEDLSKFHKSLKRKLALDKFISAGTLPSTNPDSPPVTNTPTSDQSKNYRNIPFGHQKFKRPSTWNPPGPPIVEYMCFQNENELEQSTLAKSKHSNLKRCEIEALKLLKSNDQIIIKKADKGSAVVIQNRSDYIKEGLRQLNDTNFYHEQSTDLTMIHKEKVESLVNRMFTHKEIDQKCAEYLTIETPRTANFFLLPKIHKGKIPPPGRPIVSANDCPTERISQLVDHFIQPLVPKLDSYIRDSGHFLWILDNIELPKDVILCTLDVTSLYTNIPNDEGIAAVRSALAIHRDPMENPTNNSICELLNLVLTCNNFQFDNKHYLQAGAPPWGLS